MLACQDAVVIVNEDISFVDLEVDDLMWTGVATRVGRVVFVRKEDRSVLLEGVELGNSRWRRSRLKLELLLTLPYSPGGFFDASYNYKDIVENTVPSAPRASPLASRYY